MRYLQFVSSLRYLASPPSSQTSKGNKIKLFGKCNDFFLRLFSGISLAWDDF